MHGSKNRAAPSGKSSATKRKHDQYTAKDLEGLSVAHELESFKEGEQLILTLKDKGVLDEGEDILENVNLVDEEKAAENVFKRLKKDDYNPHDEPEYDSTGALKTKDILSKYDEAIDKEGYASSKRKTFKLGAQFMEQSSSEHSESKRTKYADDFAESSSMEKVILEPAELRIASDYMDEEELAKFKKPKKKKTKAKIRQPVLDESDSNRRQPRRSQDEIEDGELIDEDYETINGFDYDYDDIMEKRMREELEKVRQLKSQQLIEQSGMRAHSSSAHISPIGLILKKMKNELKEESSDISNDGEGFIADTSYLKDGIVFDVNIEYSSFTSGEVPTTLSSQNNSVPQSPPTPTDPISHDHLMEDVSPSKIQVKQEESKRGTWNEVDMEEEMQRVPSNINDNIRIKQEIEAQPILEEEPDVGRSVASCLKLAAKKGYLEKEPKKLTGAKPSDRTAIEAQSYTIEEKFYDDDRKGNRGNRDRYTGQFQEVKDRSDYQPDIKLEYTDDSGRVLDQREAFRYLSHKFHGKGPGKNKIDKRLKKLEQESKMKQMSSIDTPLGSVAMMQAKQKELQTPYIILNGGK